jgi:hypothetical protein
MTDFTHLGGFEFDSNLSQCFCNFFIVKNAETIYNKKLATPGGSNPDHPEGIKLYRRPLRYWSNFNLREIKHSEVPHLVQDRRAHHLSDPKKFIVYLQAFVLVPWRIDRMLTTIFSTLFLLFIPIQPWDPFILVPASIPLPPLLVSSSSSSFHRQLSLPLSCTRSARWKSLPRLWIRRQLPQLPLHRIIASPLLPGLRIRPPPSRI